MKTDNFGINPETGQHRKTLTQEESRFLSILWVDHVGEEDAISADMLAVQFDCALKMANVNKEDVLTILLNSRKAWVERRKRDVRYMQTHLVIAHDVPILSKAGRGGGYWIAETEAEAIQFYDTFRKRGLTGIVKASRGKKAVLVETIGQLSFEFEDLAKSAGMDVPSGDPAAIEVVDSFLGRMLESPERFSSGLRMLSKKYGSVLLDKTQIEYIKNMAEEQKANAEELSRLVGAMG